MKKAFSLLFVTVILFSLLTGCDSNSTTIHHSIPAQNVPVSISMTDDPPTGVSVLFFQVSLTAASLTPASTSVSGTPVSLITTPIQVDVTQLQALSAFLSTANVPAASYSSMSLTFANPQLVIFNASDQSIASTCAVGAVCQLTPTLDDSATVTLSGAPFPVNVAVGSPLGFLVDFHLNTIIQPDLSVNLGVANGVTISQLPPSVPSQPPQFGFLTGTVESVDASQNQFTVQTAWGKSFTIDTNSSTVLADWPPCTSPGGISCLSAGDVVRVQIASVESDGDLLAAQVTWVQTASQQTVIGTIVAIPPLPLPAGETIIQLVLHQNPTASANLPVGGLASVAVWAQGTGGHTATTFSIDTDGFTIPSGYTFASSSDLAVGQTVQVTVASGSLQPPITASTSTGGWGPPAELSFTASNLQLEPSQLTGTVSVVGSSGFTLEYGYSPCSIGPVVCDVVILESANVVSTSQTTYQGFTPDDLSGVAVDDVVSVNGWFFPPNSMAANPSNTPTIVAQTVTLHPEGWF